jgi:hypothetical protein
MNDRRSFLNKMGLLSASAIAANLLQPVWSRDLQAALKNSGTIPPSDLATDEDFWYYVQQSLYHCAQFYQLK